MGRHFTAAIALAALCASAVGLGAGSIDDPHRQLADATRLFDKEGSPLKAERLIRTAIETCQQQGDEACVADGWLTYGFFFRSPSIDGMAKFYRDTGFIDPAASFDTRVERSAEYFSKAATAFAAQQRYERAAHAYFNAGFSLAIAQQRTAACDAFDKSLASSRQNAQLHPPVKQEVPRGFKNFEVFVAKQKEIVGCR